jgi:RND family efflux transporter MFP subunit
MIPKKSLASSWIISVVILSVLTPLPAKAGLSAPIKAISNPSADVTLSFVQPGCIAKVYFKEGDPVKAGQVLVQQDDAVEQAQLAQLEAASQDTTQIEASEAALAQRRVDLKKLETAAARKAATELEVEHARLSVKMAELSLQLAKFEHEQAKRKYNEAVLGIERMSLKSPIDGRIEEIHVEAGESVNVLADVVRVVQIDPLWIDVPVPLARGMALSFGKAAKVEFPEPGKVSIEGRIIYVAAVADAASSTLRVRIEVPNKTNRPAGEHVEVVFPTPPSAGRR